MTAHLEAGRKGEQYAADYLRNNGYRILFQNWRYKHLEVDIIAKDEDTLVFVEVKARKSTAFGNPEAFVDWRKQGYLIRAAEVYLAGSGYQGEIRFDIVSVYLTAPIRVELIKDAFWSN